MTLVIPHNFVMLYPVLNLLCTVYIMSISPPPTSLLGIYTVSRSIFYPRG